MPPTWPRLPPNLLRSQVVSETGGLMAFLSLPVTGFSLFLGDMGHIWPAQTSLALCLGGSLLMAFRCLDQSPACSPQLMLCLTTRLFESCHIALGCFPHSHGNPRCPLCPSPGRGRRTCSHFPPGTTGQNAAVILVPRSHVATASGVASSCGAGAAGRVWGFGARER